MAKWNILFRLFGCVLILVRKIVFSYQLTLSIFLFFSGEILLLNQILKKDHDNSAFFIKDKCSKRNKQTKTKL